MLKSFHFFLTTPTPHTPHPPPQKKKEKKKRFSFLLPFTLAAMLAIKLIDFTWQTIYVCV
jgi:hypothetical protein